MIGLSIGQSFDGTALPFLWGTAACALIALGIVLVTEPRRLFAGVEDERFYFVHSYGVRALPPAPGRVVTWAEHGGDPFVAAVEEGPLAATQFHPEKSGDAGARLIANWVAQLS